MSATGPPASAGAGDASADPTAGPPLPPPDASVSAAGHGARAPTGASAVGDSARSVAGRPAASAAALALGLRAHAPALAAAAAVAALSLIVGALVMNIGEGHLSLPWNYASEGDTKFYLLLIKGIIEHGSYQVNPSLGAPFGLQLYDFPQGGDNLSLLIVRVLGAFSANPAWVLNVFFLLTFPLVAASAFAALRALGVSIGAAFVGAAIFALLPYHFYRGESQVLLSAYYGVPLGALLFMRAWVAPGLFARRPGVAGAAAWLSPTTLFTVACCAVVGSTGLYYAVFAVLLLLASALLGALVGRGRAACLSGVAVAGLIAATLALNLSPTLAYRAAHGTNTAIKRTTIEADQFGLRLTDLLLPVEEYRLSPLGNVNQRYTEATSAGYCEACYENLGTVGSIGFSWLALIALVAIVGVVGAGGIAGRISKRMQPGSLYRPAALGVSLSFVLATIGGLSSLIAFFVTRDIRGWNRISLFIAFFSLLAAMLLLDALLRRLAARLPGRGAALGVGAAVCAVVLVLGVLDETSPFAVPKYEKDAKQWRSDAAFVRGIEARMPSGAAIFQLPYVPFPEGYGANGDGVSAPNPNFGTTYELARGPIHASGALRWSYAAMKGRPADWQAPLATQPLYLSLVAAAADGFDGLWVDPHGYSAAARPRLAPVLEALLGVPALYSPAHDLMFFDLRPFAARLASTQPPARLAALRSSTLHPLRAECETEGIELTNPSQTAQAATLQMRVSMRADHPLPLVIHYPGGIEELRPLTAKPIFLSRALRIPPGTSAIDFSLSGTPAPLRPRVSGPVVEALTLTVPALVPYLAPPAGLPGAKLKAGYPPPACLQSVQAVTSSTE